MTYAPPDRQEQFFYPCKIPTDTEIISSCPPKYNDWTLSENCKSSSTIFIYYGNRIFKNFYCAICHLGDNLKDVHLTPPKGLSLASLALETPVIGKSQATGNHIIRFSYESNQCCGLCENIVGRYSCAMTDQLNSSWINTIATLKHGGSNTRSAVSSLKNSKNLSARSRISLDFANVCPQTSTCGPSMLDDSPVAENLIVFPPLEAILSGNTIEKKIKKFVRKSRVKKTVIKQPSNNHEKFKVCKDKSIFSKASNGRSNKIFLSPSGILVSRCIHICQCVIFLLCKVKLIKIHQ